MKQQNGALILHFILYMNDEKTERILFFLLKTYI